MKVGGTYDASSWIEEETDDALGGFVSFDESDVGNESDSLSRGVPSLDLS